MRLIRRLAFALCTAPLALALAACGSGEGAGEGTALSGEPIDPVAAPAGASWLETAETTEMGGVLVGNPDAPLELVEYASHTCPACAAFVQTGGSDLERYVESGVVSFELRNQIHDPLDLTFAVLARCGNPATFYPLAKQGWADLNQIGATASADPGALEAATQAPQDQRLQRIGEATGMVDWFAARGIPRDRALQCLGDLASAEAIVERSNRQSEELEVSGTPTFFLNGAKLDAQDWSGVETALEQAGAR